MKQNFKTKLIQSIHFFRSLDFVTIFLFVLILYTAACLRLSGLNWDQNHHLHPDERFLTMVTGAMQWPQDLHQYLDTDTSKLNPHNISFSFYVYGTWPLVMVKAVSEFLGKYNYSDITLIGRASSAMVDVLTTVVIYFIALSLSKNKKTALLAMLLYCLTALAIQQAHFFTVDPYETFFTSIVLLLLVKNRPGILLGVALGLAIASKISAILLLVPVGIYFLISLIKPLHTKRIYIIFSGIVCFIILVLSIRLAYPYLFSGGLIPKSLNPKVLTNWKELKGFSAPHSYFPPAVQWTRTKAWLFPANELFWIGLGPVHGLLTVMGLALLILTKKSRGVLLLFLHVVIVFLYEGAQTAKTLRYFYPLLPALTVITAYSLNAIREKYFYRHTYIIPIFLVALYIWPVSIMSMYLRTNSRIAASEWMYENIPKGAVVAGEAWDDYLPVTIDERRIHEQYNIVSLSINGPDTDDKWNNINETLAQTEYIVLSSNRSYGSIMTVEDLYPRASKYYKDLFENRLPFTKIAEFTSRPNIPIPGIQTCIDIPFQTYGIIAKPFQECPLPGISFVDDYAEELWTVYEHPKVIIFRRN